MSRAILIPIDSNYPPIPIEDMFILRSPQYYCILSYDGANWNVKEGSAGTIINSIPIQNSATVIIEDNALIAFPDSMTYRFQRNDVASANVVNVNNVTRRSATQSFENNLASGPPYGQCYICKDSSHWANACPKRFWRPHNTSHNHTYGECYICQDPSHWACCCPERK